MDITPEESLVELQKASATAKAQAMAIASEMVRAKAQAMAIASEMVRAMAQAMSKNNDVMDSNRAQHLQFLVHPRCLREADCRGYCLLNKHHLLPPHSSPTSAWHADQAT